MKTPMPRFPVSRLRPSMVISVALATPALACINGHEFHVQQLRAARPDSFQVKPPLLNADELKLRPPTPLPVIAPPTIALETSKTGSSVFLDYIVRFEGQQLLPLHRTFEKRIDYSVALIRVGRVNDAIEELRGIEADFPGRYMTATNLGTAHELAGNLEEALEWISRGVERNPESHAGTEWLHVAILRAKLKMKSDPAWLAVHRVLEGFEERASEEIVRAIEYQLNERLVFVRPHDAVVCDLFYEAARRLDPKDSQAVERRGQYLRESLRFGDWRKAEVEQAWKG